MYNTLCNQNDDSLISNAFGFMRFPINFQPYDSNGECIITGVPFDATTTGRPGSRLGPGAIRQMSTNLAWEKFRWPWNFNLQLHLNVIDCGDLVYSVGDLQDLSNKIEIHATKLINNGKIMMTLGGDHYITLPLLRSHFNYFGKLALIHFDAHTDTCISSSIFDHGTVFLSALKENLIDPYHSIQIGIRTEFQEKLGFKILNSAEVNDYSVEDILKKIKKTVNKLPVYLSFDIDCLDPAYAPGTGTPVIGGITTYKAAKLIRGLDEINIIGMDLVEVAPCYDNHGITALAAATLVLDMLYLQAKKKIIK